MKLHKETIIDRYFFHLAIHWFSLSVKGVNKKMFSGASPVQANRYARRDHVYLNATSRLRHKTFETAESLLFGGY